MQNSTFLVILRPIFAPKLKTAPPKGFGSQSCEGHAVIWTRIVEFFGSGAHQKSVKTFFFSFFFLEITCFWLEKPLEFLILTFEFRWRPFFSFFGDHLLFTEKLSQSNSRLMKILVKFVYGWIKLPKKPPPPPFAKPWLRACWQLWRRILANNTAN